MRRRFKPGTRPALPTCAHTGKVCFATEKAAERGLGLIHANAARRGLVRTEQRWYPCRSCAQWHLTSRPEAS